MAGSSIIKSNALLGAGLQILGIFKVGIYPWEFLEINRNQQELLWNFQVFILSVMTWSNTCVNIYNFGLF